MHSTRRLDLIHIAMKFHQNIPYGYLVMMRTRIVCNILTKGQKLRKGEQPFLYTTCCFNPIHIAIKFHKNIPHGYLVMARTRTVYAGWTDRQCHNIIHLFFFSKWAYKKKVGVLFPKTSRKHTIIILTLLVYSKTGVNRGIHYFSYFCSKT